MFALGSVDPLLVETFSGFDVPSFKQLVRLLDDGASSLNEVIQSGAPGRGQAQLTGTITTAADVATLRGYYRDSTAVDFTDGNGNTTEVILLEFAAEDFTDWWTFTATLVVTTLAGS